MHVLIAIHDLLNAETVLHFASQIADLIDEPPTILTVVDHRADRSSPQADTNLAEMHKHSTMPKYHSRQRIGHPVEEILNEAMEGGYDLIVIGERSTHWLARFFQRSVAVHVAARAPCPVIVVKGMVKPIRRLLLCDSGGEKSSLLSRFTAQLADVLEGEEEITVLHVMSQISAGPGVPGRQLRAEADELIQEHTLEGELLERDIQELTRKGVHSRPKIRHGLVEDEILLEAQSGDYDLVVIGIQHNQGWQKFLLDDLTRKILIHIDRPVLVVK